MSNVTITPEANGPLEINGPVTIHDEAGNPIETTDRTWLCRCGFSENKPFCDGSHRRREWSSASD
jgi:CDGSH iron-sulfur domain-containing protein 3